jgi:hypothetical protein
LLPFTGQYYARSQPEDKPSADGGRNVRQNAIITPNLGLAFDLRIRSRLTLTQFYHIRGTLDTAKCASTYLITMISALVTSTLLAGFANAASIAKRENDGNFFSDLSLRTVGARNTLVSHPSIGHDVPLYPDESNKRIVNFVVEVPRWEDAKIEIRRQEPLSKSSSSGLARYD